MQQGACKKGYTLVEILIVVTIMGIVAAVAIPNFSSGPNKLELATAEVVEAIRFAQSEAMRTGDNRGVHVTIADDRLQLFIVASLPSPPLLPLVLDLDYTSIRHPVDKKIYDLQFQTDLKFSGVDISAAVFNYQGGLSIPYLNFSSAGVPLIPHTGPGAAFMLTDGSISLSYGDDTSMIGIDPMTGRVMVR